VSKAITVGPGADILAQRRLWCEGWRTSAYSDCPAGLLRGRRAAGFADSVADAAGTGTVGGGVRL